MKFIISRYNNDIDWARKYTNDIVIYDRSEVPLPNTKIVPNIGTDIYDKFSFIVENYNSLPEIAVYTKGNLFKYITQEEFEDKLKTNEFEPLLTKNHKTYLPTCFYSEDGMYNELNDRWYLNHFPIKCSAQELMEFLGIADREYLKFAPGSNYILKKENILKHPKDFYVKLLEYLGWARYPAEAQIIERSLYHLWK